MGVPFKTLPPIKSKQALPPIKCSNQKFVRMKITVEEFKGLTQALKVCFKKSNTTGKVFATAGDKIYRCQQAIDLSKPVVFIFDSGMIDAGCFINGTPTDTTDIGAL